MKNPRDRIIIIALFLIILFVFYTTVIFSASDFSISARSAVLYEPTTENFLYTKNADACLPMASTTKIMTALVALENYPLEKEVAVADEAIGIEGSSLYLKKGEILSMRELLVGLMLRSANDAAVAIACAVAGSVESFSDMMNDKAVSLGLVNTHFVNPHGLDNPEHYTTARELALISAEAMKNEIFKEIVSTKKETISNSENEARLVVNHNKLLSLYEGAIGIKTGFTKRCGRCLVGAAERDGLSFITVTINAPDDWNDHEAMFDYGFSTLEMRKLAMPEEFVYEIPVIGGTEGAVTVKNRAGFSLIMKKSDPFPKVSVKLERYSAAPIKKDEIMGKVVFTYDGAVIGEVDLVAYNDISAAKDKSFFSIFK